MIAQRDGGRSESIAAWATRRDGSCAPVPLPPIDERARKLAQSLSSGIKRGPLVEPLTKWEPAAIRREFDRLEVELEVEERVRLNELNARLRRLGIKTALRPVQSKPKAPQPSRVIQHPAPAIRRARNLDEELLEWWRAAPNGLDSATWERVLTVLQERHHGASIADIAGARG